MHGRSSKAFSGSPLASRGGPVRTFAGLAAFAVLSLFGLGSYLIEQQFTDPMQSQAPALLLGALLLATAIILLYSIVQQAARARRATVSQPRTSVQSKEKTVAVARRRTLEWRHERKDLSFHNRYIDHARIRLE